MADSAVDPLETLANAVAAREHARAACDAARQTAGRLVVAITEAPSREVFIESH